MSVGAQYFLIRASRNVILRNRRKMHNVGQARRTRMGGHPKLGPTARRQSVGKAVARGRDQLPHRRVPGRTDLVQSGSDGCRASCSASSSACCRGWAAPTAWRSCCPSRSRSQICPAAHVGHHPALVHLLGCAVRRRDHVDTVQHSGRAMVGGDHLRRPSHGAAGARRRGPDGGVHLVIHRRADRRYRHHVLRADGGELCACVSARRKCSPSSS